MFKTDWEKLIEKNMGLGTKPEKLNSGIEMIVLTVVGVHIIIWYWLGWIYLIEKLILWGKYVFN